MTAKKAFPQKSFPATVTFRPDQFAIVRRLQDQRKLSTVCQKAVDLDTELEDLPDGVRDDAMEAAAASLFDEWSLSGSYAISQDGGGSGTRRRLMRWLWMLRRWASCRGISSWHCRSCSIWRRSTR
jgi:hypothetical protein